MSSSVMLLRKSLIVGCVQEAGATMTKLSTIPQHQLSITCGLCKHHTMLEVANLIAVVVEAASLQEVGGRAKCYGLEVKF